jgi:signal transduction histidine kinase
MKFSVSDSGIGISKETKEKLFTKFGRGAGSALNGGGSGLGLYLAQAIVEAHKGTIEVSSQGEGKGSTFSVFLPLHQQTKK